MTTTTKEKPILFSAPMVRAILDGRKTQTRRITGLEDVNAYPGRMEGAGAMGQLGYRGPCLSDYYIRDKAAYRREPGRYHWFLGEQGREANPIPVKCPYGGIGSTLWVRETFTWGYEGDDAEERAAQWHGDKSKKPEGATFWYAATDEKPDLVNLDGEERGWHPSIHMPRWASRITLEITDVRVERLQSITEEDAKAEGMADEAAQWRDGFIEDHRQQFQRLWTQINGADSWDANPFCWVISFRRITP